jgi:ATP-dependent Zn protease
MTNTNSRGTAYRQAAHAVVAHALGQRVTRIYISDEEDDVGKTETSDQSDLPIQDRIAICAAGTAAKPIFGFTVGSRAERGDQLKVAAIVIDLDEGSRDHVRREGYTRAEELLLKHQSKVRRVAEYLIANRSIEQGMIDRLLGRPPSEFFINRRIFRRSVRSIWRLILRTTGK